MVLQRGVASVYARGLALVYFSPGRSANSTSQHLLTPQQITRLSALRDAAKVAHDAAAAAGKLHMEAMAQAMNAASPDTTAVKAHFQEAHAGMGKAMWAMLAAAAQARAVLTDEQRARVDRWAGMMMEHRKDRS